MRIWQMCSLILVALLVTTSPKAAETLTLPDKETPVPRTTNGVPHVQIDVARVPEISEELLRRVSAISGIEIRPTIVSLPGALGFWVTDGVPLARPEVIVRGREFAHLHPDGSLHASLAPELADRAIKAGWAVKHPWADERSGWEGFVMIYTPTRQDEMDVVVDLVKQSFLFVTGRKASSM